MKCDLEITRYGEDDITDTSYSPINEVQRDDILFISMFSNGYEKTLLHKVIRLLMKIYMK